MVVLPQEAIFLLVRASQDHSNFQHLQLQPAAAVSPVQLLSLALAAATLTAAVQASSSPQPGHHLSLVKMNRWWCPQFLAQ